MPLGYPGRLHGRGRMGDADARVSARAAALVCWEATGQARHSGRRAEAEDRALSSLAVGNQWTDERITQLMQLQ